MQITLESVVRRDRWIVGAALLALTALAWAYLLAMSSGDMLQAIGLSRSGDMPDMTMPGGDMAGMDMPGMGAAGTSPADSPSVLRGYAFLSVMWLVMMVGMMTPSASPMILIYAGVSRRAASDHRPFASTAWFAAGYLIVWALFAFAAAGVQVALGSAALLGPDMAVTSHRLGGAVLIAAGLYQLLPVKQACLRQCQAPMAFISRHGGLPGDRLGAVRLGIKHGAYCVGCCWALMALLFVCGVMNLLWVAALTGLVLVEKLFPWPGIAYLGAVLLIGLGAAVAFS